MTRTLNDHIINQVNDTITIMVADEPGSGGANHQYDIYGSGWLMTGIPFQNGPISEHGANGVTHEALLAVVIDRLRSFQAGPYSCKENACALTHIEEALHWLQQRTLARMRRGVEGTSVV